MKIYQYIPTMNVETNLDTLMPMIPECWTKPTTSHPNNSNMAATNENEMEEHQIVKKLFGSPPTKTNMMTLGEGSGNKPVETPSLPLIAIKKKSRTPDIPKSTRTPSSYFSQHMFLEPKEIQVCLYLFYNFVEKSKFSYSTSFLILYKKNLLCYL